MRRARLAVLFVVGLGMLGWSTREATAAIAVDMSAIDFGDVTMNTASSPITITVSNDSTSSTVAVTFTQSAGCNGRLSFTPGSGTVPVRTPPNDGQLTTQVRFTPNSRTALSGCTITVDQMSGPDPTVTVAGDSDAPQLSVTGGNLTFSSAVRWNITGAGSTATRTLTLTNSGDADMAFANVTTTFTGTNPGDFQVVSGTETGFPIPAGMTGTIDVEFNPSNAGARSATFDVELNNDPTGETVANVNATGTGGQSILSFASSSPFNVGSTPAGGFVEASLGIRNLGSNSATMSLDIASLTITGANATDFSFRDHTCTGQMCSPPSPASIAVDATDATANYTIRCTPSANGSRTAVLTVVSNDASTGMPSSSRTINLSCTSVPPTLSATTPPAFPVTRVGTPATVQTITIGNGTGAADLTYAAATSSATEFPLSCSGGGTACLSGTVSAGSSVQIQVGFVPSAVGARAGMVTLTTNDPDPLDATRVINVSGTGAISTLNGANTIAFPGVDINTAGGVTQSYTINNTGGVSLNLVGNMTITGDAGGNFSFAFGSCTTGQTCASLPSVAAGGNTSITLRCDPTTVGAKTGTLNIPTDDPASPKTVALTCTGATPDLQIAGTPLLDFGNQRINTTSGATRTFTISNPTGTTTSTLTYTVSESSPHFSVACSAPGCTGSLAPGATPVTVTVSFRPTVTGPVTANINVATNDVSTPSVDIPVSGTGVEPLVTLTTPAGGSLSFGNVNVGATSATMDIVITNNGSMPLTVSGVTNSNPADFNLTGPTTTTVAVGSTAMWSVACAPDTQGARTGTISIANDSTNDTSVDVSLSCNALRGNLVVTSATPFAYTQATNTIDFGSTFLMQSKMTTVTITNNGNVPVTISTVTSAPSAQGYTLGAPSSMTVPANNGTITLPITFMPTSAAQGAITVTLMTDWNTLSFSVIGDGEDSGLVIMKGQGASCTTGTMTHDYGDVIWSATPATVPMSVQGFCIKNIGEAPAQLTSIALVNAGGNYTIAGVPGTLPTLTSGQQLDITVTADPNDAMLGVFMATLRVQSTLPAPDNQREVTLRLNSVGPTIVLDPGATIDFGGVDVDDPDGVTIPLVVNNMMGGALLDITGISSPTGSFSLMGAGPMTIAGGASGTIMVRFKPTVERSGATMETSSFTITTTGYYVNNVRQPVTQQITLSGYGIDQHISANPTALDFGNVYRNPRMDDPRASKTIAVCNTGEQALAVSMITSTTGPFDVTGSTSLDLPGVSGAGGSPQCQNVTVEFRPADAAYQGYTGMLTIMNDDDGAPMFEVPLSGASIARPVTVTSAVTSDEVLAVGVPVRLTELLPAGLTAQNVATPAEAFTIELRPSNEMVATVVGEADRDLAEGETEVYDLTINAQTEGQLTFTADVFLDGDPIPHQQVPVTLNAVEVHVRGGGGCSTGGGGSRGAAALLVLAVVAAVRKRRSARVAAAALAVTAIAVAAPTASAQNRDLDLSTFSPAPATEGQMFAIESPSVGVPGAWAFDLAVNHALSPMKIDDTGMAGGDVVSARTALELGFAYAVIPKLELGLRVPLLRQEGADPGIAGLDFSNGGGTTIGDIGVLARYALVDGTTKLGASATITAPTAKEDQFAGAGTVTGAARLLLSTQAGKRLTLAANGGFLVRGASTDFAGMTQGHQVLFGAGVSVRAAEKLWVIGESFGRFGLGSDDTAASTPVEATVGIRYRLGQSVALSLGGGTGIRAGIGAPKARGFLMLSFSPRARKDAPLHVYVPPPPRDVGDDDSDGVVNADDQCKLDAEDKDGYQDEDGCPDADNDGDGILDVDDKCPDQPEDKDGVDDSDGCIDGDNDGDGVPDAQDKCPTEPEDKDGFEDDDGCDEPDNDNDGVPDVLDQCAMEPETINGNADEDGCPDKGDTLIMVMPDRIEVLEPVTFQGVTTKLSKNAPKALSQIGATMRADRKIKRLRITVHVHPRNNNDEQLSQKRADEIRQWLINWGVEPERLDARGIGSKRPLVPKNQKGADQINDRVEFIIFERQ